MTLGIKPGTAAMSCKSEEAPDLAEIAPDLASQNGSLRHFPISSQIFSVNLPFYAKNDIYRIDSCFSPQR